MCTIMDTFSLLKRTPSCTKQRFDLYTTIHVSLVNANTVDPCTAVSYSYLRECSQEYCVNTQQKRKYVLHT